MSKLIFIRAATVLLSLTLAACGGTPRERVVAEYSPGIQSGTAEDDSLSAPIRSFDPELLCEAAESGDLRTVNILLDGGANPNAACEGGVPKKDRPGASERLLLAPLRLAMLPAMIFVEPMVESISIGERTPLLEAVGNNHAEITRALLAHKANPNQTVRNSYTPLSMAVYNSNIEITQMLLDCGANPDGRTKGASNNSNAWDLAEKKPVMKSMLIRYLAAVQKEEWKKSCPQKVEAAK